MLHGGGVAALLFMGFWIYCVLDVIAAEEVLVRNLPKVAWLLLVIFVPPVGGVAWLVLGRPERVGFTPGSTRYRARPTYLGPDDNPGFMPPLTPPSSDASEAEERLRAWEADLRRREDDLRRRELPPGEAPGKDSGEAPGKDSGEDSGEDSAEESGR